MAILITIFLGITALWLCYWVVVRPVLLDSVENELSFIRSELEWAVIDGLEGSGSAPAISLLSALAHPQASRWVSMSLALVVLFRSKGEIEADKERNRIALEQSPPWLQRLHQRTAEVWVKGALANSPSWWVPVAAGLLVAKFSKRVQETMGRIQIALALARKLEPAPA